MLHGVRRDRRAVAALEFAIASPFVVVLILAVYDSACAFISWERTQYAATTIAAAAAKLSVSPGVTQTALTSQQMQHAMSSIYAVMPGLASGSLSSSFSVTLSEVAYLPLCTTATGCAAQTPSVIWSTSLAEGPTGLVTGHTRACGALTAVSTFPNDSTQLTKMLSWQGTAGGASLTLPPQIVADVRYVFTPAFSLFLGKVTFWATSMLPTPLGGPSQEITYNSATGTGSPVTQCP